MGTGYTRNDAGNNIANGNVVNAADLDGEFDAIQAAFVAVSGHTHDGTAAEGGAVEVIGPNQEYVSTTGAFYPKTDGTYDLGSATLEWKDLYIDGVAYLDQADVTTLNATTVDINGGAVDGTIVGGTTPAAISGTTGTFSGTVGITANVEVGGSIYSPANTDTLVIFGGTNGDGANLRMHGSGTAAPNNAIMDADVHRFRSQAGTEWARFTGGNFGIGTTNPLTDLDVTGSAAVSGNLGIGTTTPDYKLHVAGANPEGGILVEDTSASAASPAIQVIGKRSDGNTSPAFAGKLAIASNRTDAAIGTDKKLGTIYFGGNHTDGSQANISFPASIAAVTEATFNSVSDMPTALAFYTGSTGRSLSDANVDIGTERLRIDSDGNVGIGTSSPSVPLTVTGNMRSTGNAVIGTTSDWTFASNWRGVKLSDRHAIQATNAASSVALSSNAAIGSSGWEYTVTGEAAGNYTLNSGTHIWNYAASGTDGDPVTFTEAMRLTSSGSLGIGTASPVTDVDINGQLGVAAGTAAAPSYSFRTDLDTGIYSSAANQLAIATNGAQVARVNNVGAWNFTGTGTNIQLLGGTVDLGAEARTWAFKSPATDSLTDAFVFETGNSWQFNVDTAAALTINASGQTVVANELFAADGTAAAPSVSFSSDPDTGMFSATANRLSFSCAGVELLQLENDQIMHYNNGSAASPSFSFRVDPDTGVYRYGLNNLGFAAGGVYSARATPTGFIVAGALSKGSGSFRIPHPIREGHDLVHSFVEGPTADNIYRGVVRLVDGKAVVNLDEAARMTEGTFVALNTNTQCFTTNEDDWTAIRGKVNGNLLTIEAQDPQCTASISWLVIGERHDQHMMDTDWTDENGRVITEPLTEVPADGEL